MWKSGENMIQGNLGVELADKNFKITITNMLKNLD